MERKVVGKMGADSASASSHPSEDTTRRRLLTLMGAGGAATLATLVSSKEAQAGHDSTNTFHLGEDNTAPEGVATRLDMSVDNSDGSNGLMLRNQANGSALVAQADGAAIQAFDEGGTSRAILAFGGVRGLGHSREEDLPEGQPLGPGEGVVGESEQPDKAGVLGESVLLIERGFEGQPPAFGIGVLGRTGAAPGVGVIGEAHVDDWGFGEVGTEGTGVLGRSGTGVGVHGLCPDGFALRAEGKSAFSTAGAAVIPAGQSSLFVADADVTGNSHISVTLVSDPGSRSVHWIERNAGSGFTVRMTSAPVNKRPETSFTYLITEPTV
jgi:hypothetical protein